MLIRGDKVKEIFGLKSVPKKYTIIRNFRFKEGDSDKKMDIHIVPENRFLNGRYDAFKVWAEAPDENEAEA
jgi:hypothetical protein